MATRRPIGPESRPGYGGASSDRRTIGIESRPGLGGIPNPNTPGGGISTDPGDLQHQGPRVPYPDPWIGAPSGSVVNSTNGGAAARVNGAAVPEDVLPVVYGRGRVQGKIWHYVRDGTGGGTFWVWLCCGPIQSIEKVFSNGIEVTSNPLWSWDTYLGSATPAAPPGGSLGPPVTGGVVPFPQLFQYTAYLRIYVDPANTLDIGPIEVEVKGKVIPDPRENRIPNCNDFTTGWASNYLGPDLIDVAQNDPFCGTNASLLTFSGAENDWYYNLGSLALTAGDYVTVSLYVRVPSGSPDAGFRIEAVNQGTGPGDQEQTFQYVVAQSWWQLIEVTHLCTVDGPLGPSLVISFGFGAYLPAPLLVYCAQIEIKKYRGGRCLTTGAEVLPVTQWTRNLPLILLDILRADPDGGAYADDDILIGSFGDVATIAGEGNAEDSNIAVGDIRWGLDIVFKEIGELKAAIDKARAVAPIDCYLSNDVWRCDIDTKCGDPEIAFSTERNVVSSQLLYETPPAGDSPTKVTLSFADPDNNWKPNSASFPDGPTGTRDNSVNLDASASYRQMKQMAAYMQRAAACNRFQLARTTPVTARCHRYQRVTVVDPTRGIPLKTCVVVGYELLDSGEWSVNARVTNDGIFDPIDPGTPTGDNTPQPGSVVPPVVQPVCDSAFNVSWQAERVYKDRVLYPSGEWSGADAALDATKINDGDTGTIGADFTAAADSEVTLTLPAATAIGGLRITLVANPPVALSGPWNVYADGVLVTNGFKRPDNHDVTDSDPGYWHEWDVVTGTAFKLKKGSSTVGTEEITELQYREYQSLYAYSHHVTVKDHATGTPLKTLLTTGAGSLNLAEFAAVSVRADGVTIKTLDVDLVNATVKNVESIPVRVVHTEVVGAVDTTQAVVRMLAVDHTTHKATWQLGCLYDDSTEYGDTYWALANVEASPDLAKINDKVTNVKAFGCNAAGATTATLDITGEPKAFCAVDIIVPSGTKLFTDHTTSGSYPGPSPNPGAGPLGVWAAEYWDGAAWVRPPQTLKTSNTVVTYSGRAVPSDYPSQGWTADKYQITASRIRIEWDPQLYPTARDKWRVIQTTTDAIALDVYEIQWLSFVRWISGVRSFGVYAGLVSSSAGATQATDGGVITPTAGKSVAIGAVAADPPTLNVDYSFASASLAAGTVRRTAWPGATGPYLDSVGWLDEVTVIPFLETADGPGLVEGTARFAWDYSYSLAVGLGE